MPENARAHYKLLSSRAKEVADRAGAVAERYEWLHHTFLDLAVRETQKQVKEVMSPVYPLLDEDDTINKAIYVMFKENIRQPMVMRDGEIIGLVSIMDIFPALLDVAGDECFLAL
jgi:predicted transcriptional regulator